MIPRPFAYWLIPAQPHYDTLTATIQDLAQQYNAIPFAPHLTIFAGAYLPGDKLPEIGQQIFPHLPAIHLKTQPVAYSEIFFKTLFIPFADQQILSDVARRIKAHLQRPGAYQLHPHLSLLYKTLPASTKQEIVRSLNLDLPATIPFNRVKLAKPGAGSLDWMDIAGWQIEKSWELPTWELPM